MQTSKNVTYIDSKVIHDLEEAIIHANLQTGRRLIKDMIAQIGHGALIFDVFDPILTNLGQRLKRQEASLAQCYVASMLMDDALQSYEAALSGVQEDQVVKGPVVMANIEDDYHPLGRKIVVTLLKINRWTVSDLGVDVEAKAIVDEAEKIGAGVIGISAMIFTTAMNIQKVRDELRLRKLENKIKLAVGGAVFRLRPELAVQVGADGTAANAFLALQLFDDLWRQSNTG